MTERTYATHEERLHAQAVETFSLWRDWKQGPARPSLVRAHTLFAEGAIGVASSPRIKVPLSAPVPLLVVGLAVEQMTNPSAWDVLGRSMLSLQIGGWLREFGAVRLWPWLDPVVHLDGPGSLWSRLQTLPVGARGVPHVVSVGAPFYAVIDLPRACPPTSFTVVVAAYGLHEDL